MPIGEVLIKEETATNSCSCRRKYSVAAMFCAGSIFEPIPMMHSCFFIVWPPVQPKQTLRTGAHGACRFQPSPMLLFHPASPVPKPRSSTSQGVEIYCLIQKRLLFL